MVPRALHSVDDILDAARTLVLERGVQSATVNAISKQSGAPVGSLYHRFGSRDELVAELWVRAVRRSQASFLSALRHPKPEEAGVGAALSIHDFVREHRADARLLVAFRREDLLHDVRSTRLIRTLQELNRPLEEAVTDLARRLFGRASRDAVEQTTLAVIDLPFGAIRRHLVADGEIPAALRGHLEAAVRAVLRERKRS
jgi:AcrR family transcriptional regulator